MKTNNVLKIGFFTVAFALLSVGVKAQTNTNYVEYGAAGTPESIDTVTVGSRMPYYVAPQTAVTGLTFEYKWLFSPVLSILNYGGDANATTGVGGASVPYYKENEISVKMPNTPQTITVNTNVQSLSGTTVLCPSGNDNTYNIHVVAKPTLTWPNPQEVPHCGITAPVNIPFTLTGYGKWEIFYEVVYTAWTTGANASTILTNQKAEVGSNTSKTGSYGFDIAAAIFTNPGKYEVKIINLTDRISRKSLDAIAATPGTGGDIPAATNVYTVNVYPAPVTNPLQHVKNMP